MITLSTVFRHHRPQGLLPQTILDLSTAIANCAAAPCLRWRLRFEADTNGQRLAVFAASVHQGFPAMYEQGRLLVERYTGTDRNANWDGA